RQKQKKLIMLPSETMIWQPEFTDKTLSRKPGAVQPDQDCQFSPWLALADDVPTQTQHQQVRKSEQEHQ
ncbi:hypothetical protein ODR23_23975, partial [Escherichia coli]|nr:hypothetical protein [Escherichia coli]